MAAEAAYRYPVVSFGLDDRTVLKELNSVFQIPGLIRRNTLVQKAAPKRF
jgi:hypothetical protein